MPKNLESRAFLERLISTPSPTGYEAAGQRIWLDFVKAVSDRQVTDAYGSAAACLDVNPEFMTVMLEAHADEIGMVVQYIDETGFVYISRIGGSDPGIARARRIHIHSRDGIVEGIIGNTAIHLQVRDGSQKQPTWKDLFVDIGASTREEALALVQVGDPITYVDQFEWINDNLLSGRALDNRIGGFIIAMALKKLNKSRKKLKVNVVALNAVQEEIGGYGARMMTHRLRPNLAIVTDVTHATDTPGINQKEHGAVKLGGGPTVTHGAASHPLLVRHIEDVSAKSKIDIQHEAASVRTGTDTDSIYHIRDGVPSVLISLPLRYMHSPVEMASMSDVESLVDLMTDSVLALDGKSRFHMLE